MISLLITLLVHHPKKLLASALGITLVFAYFVPRIELQHTAAQFYPPPENEERRFHDEMYTLFGKETSVVVVIQSDNIFQPETLRKIRDLTQGIEKIEQIESIASLASAQRIVSTESELKTEKYLSEIPQSPAALEQLKNEIQNHPIYSGQLVSPDGRTTVISIVFESTEDLSFLRQQIKEIQHLVDEHQDPEEIFITGPVVLTISAFDIFTHDMKRFGPFVIVVMLLILFFRFRSLLGFTLPLLSALLGIIWTFGAMGWFEIPLTMLSSSLPPILIAVGCSYAVYLLSAYFSLKTEEEDSMHRISQMLHKTLLAILLCGGTTVLGFFGLWLNDILLVEQMGHAAMIGIASILFMTTFVLPCLFLLIGIAQRNKNHQKGRAIREKKVTLWDRIPLFYIHKAKWILGSCAIVIFSFVYFIPQLRTEMDMVNLFEEGSSTRQNLLRFADALHMNYNIHLVLVGDEADHFKNPVMLKKIQTLQERISEIPKVGKTTSLADFLISINLSFNENKPEFRKIPDSDMEVGQYLLLYSIADAEEALFHYVSEDYRVTRIQVNTGLTSDEKLFDIVDPVSQACHQLFDAGTQCHLTGHHVLTAQSKNYLSQGVLKGIGVALVIILMLLFILFRSIKIGFIAMIPNVIPILVILGFMGLTGIPFNVGTCMTVSIALAMAIDDTLHFFVHYYQELKQSNHYLVRAQTGILRTDEQNWAMIETWRQLRRPMATTTLTIVAGFLVLLLSDLTPIAYLGLLTSLAMIAALLTDLILTPVLLILITI